MSEAQEFVDTYKIQTITASASVEVKEVVDQGRPSKRPRRETTHTISIWIHFDGGSRGNPGLGGAGAQVVVSKVTPNQSTPTSGKILHVRKYLGKHGVTNNQAEYHGLLAGLEETLSQVQTFVTESGVNSGNAPVFAAKIKVKGDSDLILQQVKGEYKVRSDKLVGLHKNVHKVVSQIKSLASVEIDYDHVFRAENAVADGKLVAMIRVLEVVRDSGIIRALTCSLLLVLKKAWQMKPWIQKSHGLASWRIANMTNQKMRSHPLLSRAALMYEPCFDFVRLQAYVQGWRKLLTSPILTHTQL
jgi:ribonuclease HI